ncbi:patatin-like phospholipase domain-containing protein 4 isoform X1 [Carettochelys insculpta]|uniref:patatin-like phospholipase domain-containing protein 4 isoform X1 n=1 Tax=Carettochelys insculpta TaxID=44489 RepID=UPI003EBD6D8F
MYCYTIWIQGLLSRGMWATKRMCRIQRQWPPLKEDGLHGCIFLKIQQFRIGVLGYCNLRATHVKSTYNVHNHWLIMDMSTAVGAEEVQTAHEKGPKATYDGKQLIMEAKMKHLNLSFAACGFLGIYHLGAASALYRHGKKLLKVVKAFAGASAGSLVATVLLTMPENIEECQEFTYKFAEEIRKLYFGAITPGYDFMTRLRTGIESFLPSNAHEIAQNRLYVSVTNTKNGKNHLISNFPSREDLIKVLLASSFVPVYAGIKAVEYKGEVVRALNALLLKRVVRVGDLDAAVEGFAAMGFPNCFGALDGIPLPIRAPDHSGGRYINRKGYHFVVLQSMVDSCGHFQDIYVGWPGSTHDACVFRNSGLCCRPQAETYIPQREIPLGDTTTVPLCLVGDAAYHLQPWLMRPYTGHFTDSQERYNARHNHAQQVVERAFERLLALPPGTPRPGPPKHPSGCGGLLHTPQPVGKQGGGLRAGLGTGGRNSLPPAIRRSELPAPPGQGLGPGGPKGVL